MTAFGFWCKLEMKLCFHLLFTPFFPSSSDRSAIVPHKSDQTRTRVRSQRRWDETAFKTLTFLEPLKNKNESISRLQRGVLVGKNKSMGAADESNPSSSPRSSSAAQRRPPITAQSLPNPKHASASERPAPPLMEASEAAAQIRRGSSWGNWV